MTKDNAWPHRVPDPVTPAPDKLDLPRLEADIPKFLKNSRAFEEEGGQGSLKVGAASVLQRKSLKHGHYMRFLQSRGDSSQ